MTRACGRKETMVLKAWQFVAMMLMAFVVAAGLAHAMELTPKMAYDAQLYVELHRTLYRFYGPTAGIAEFLATIVIVGLAWRVRECRGIFLPTAASAALMIIAHLAFYVIVQPANATMVSWPLDKIPAEWTRWRDRWEYGHALRALLTTAAFGALVISLLRAPSVISDAETRDES
jgi:hypothetical protein